MAKIIKNVLSVHIIVKIQETKSKFLFRCMKTLFMLNHSKFDNIVKQLLSIFNF